MLVASLLKPGDSFSQAEILDALVNCSGSVEDAAERLAQVASSSKGKRVSMPASSRKRKRDTKLDAWLKPPSKGTSTEHLKVPPQKVRRDEPKPKPLSSASAKPVTDLMTILRPPPSSEKKGPPKFAPLMLSSPALVAEHTPCTLHHSILPPELACELFYTMLDASRAWQRNKWWLFDKVVESPHLTSFFARRTNGLDDDESWQEAAQYWYNGRATEAPSTFPEPMERACQIIERVVNEEMAKRKRFKLEWGDPDAGSPPVWRANVAASNCYEGSKESVGWHSDQLTYLGPYPTIASLSLGTRRNFSLREVVPSQDADIRRARTFNIPLPHNSLTIMHASCQETFKHSIPPQSSIDLYRPAHPRGTHPANPDIGSHYDEHGHYRVLGAATANSSDPSIAKPPPSPPSAVSSTGASVDAAIEPSNCRINITFRFYRPDFRPGTIPKCHCGIPTILRPDMKSRVNGETDRYWWTCYAGAQNDGKGCKFWKIMDMKSEGRGPCVGGLKP